MSKIYIYGCSHATNDYNNIKIEDSWMYLVATHCKMDILNYAEGGISNDYIFKKLLETINDISTDDLIIVQLTYGTRFMVGSKNLRPSKPIYEKYFEYVENNGLEINYIKNLLSIESLIEGKNYLITSVDGFFNSTFSRYNIKLPFEKNTVSIFPRVDICESFDVGEDGKHLSKLGHNQLANWYIKRLTKTLN
jgi:hypothetical protein